MNASLVLTLALMPLIAPAIPADGEIAARDQPLGFERLDTDGNGHLGTAEVTAMGQPGLLPKADRDRDGQLSRAELHRFLHGA